MPLARTIKQQRQQAQAEVQPALVPILKKKATSYPNSHPTNNHQQQQQQLCDETRAQYELLLQRQETSHERQLQAAQLNLQQLLSSHLSLVEHEKILFAEGEFHRRECEHQAVAHTQELNQLKAQWRQKWQTREKELRLRWEEEKNLVLDMLPPLELERNDALRLLKEQEIDQPTWSKELHEANCARELAEARFDEACKRILTFKTCVKQLELKPDKLKVEKQKKMEFCDKWQQTKPQFVEMKGELSRKITMLESDLQTRRSATLLCRYRVLRIGLSVVRVAGHLTRLCLQKEVSELGLQYHHLETEVAYKRESKHRTDSIRKRVRGGTVYSRVAERQTPVDAPESRCSRAARMQVGHSCAVQCWGSSECLLCVCATTNQTERQELATKLELLTRGSGEREATWRHEKALQWQEERQHDEQLLGLLFGSSGSSR